MISVGSEVSLFFVAPQNPSNEKGFIPVCDLQLECDVFSVHQTRTTLVESQGFKHAEHIQAAEYRKSSLGSVLYSPSYVCEMRSVPDEKIL